MCGWAMEGESSGGMAVAREIVKKKNRLIFRKGASGLHGLADGSGGIFPVLPLWAPIEPPLL